MKIAVCDDEKYFVENIIGRIKAFGIIDTLPNQFDGFTSSKTLLNQIKDTDYDLVYLDIQMDDKNGIEIAKEIRKTHPHCIIIFVTAYDKYIHESYRVNAFQYIEKPIKDSLFNQELQRAIKQYKHLGRNILFYTTIGNKLVKTDSIIFLETNYGKYSLYTTGQTYHGSTKNLVHSKQEMLKYHFYPLDRSTIINFKHVDAFTNDEITMSNKMVLYITKNNRKDFKEKYYDFIDTEK